MTPIQQARHLCVMLLAVFFLCAFSEQATAPISIQVPDQSPATVMKKLEQIGASLKYRKGIITSKEVGATTVLEDEKRYRFYFVNEEFRTSFKIEIPKDNTEVKVVFEEFGVKDFSRRGIEQYQQLVKFLATAFGNDTVVTNNETSPPRL